MSPEGEECSATEILVRLKCNASLQSMCTVVMTMCVPHSMIVL